jgi:hypothetical protein
MRNSPLRPQTALQPVVHRKFEPHAWPGRFLGFDQPFGSGIYKVLRDSGDVTQSQTAVNDDALQVPPPVILPGAAQQHSRWAGEQAVGMRDCESDSEDEVDVHPRVPPVSPMAPPTGARDCDNADDVEIRRGLPVTAIPQVPPAAQQAGQPLIEDEQPAEAVDHQPTAPATGRPVRATRDAHLRYASAAMKNPVHGGEDTEASQCVA